MNDEPKDRYPDIEMPVFKSKIPDYILKKATESEAHILNALNCKEQEGEWAAERFKEQLRIINEHDRKILSLDGRVSPMEKFVSMLKSYWAFAAVLAVAITSLLSLLKTLGIIK